MTRPFLVAAALAVGCQAALGQHDPHRNAVRHLAAGKLDAAEKELAKADAEDSETHFVHTLRLLRQGDVRQAVDSARATLDAGLPLERFLAGPRPALEPLYATDAWKQWTREQPPSPLVHGPTLGAATGTSMSFWLRTAEEAKVEVQVYQGGSDEPVASGTGETMVEKDRTVVISVGGLRPDTEHRYRVLVEGRPVETATDRFRTFPEVGKPAKFNVGFGGGAGFVPKWERMWDTIRAQGPRAFLMLGDNVYIDDPTQPLTQDYCYYRRQSRPEWRRLTGATAMAAIYDDHDFGTNDCVPGPEIDTPPWKRSVWRKFTHNWVNHDYGGGEEQPGCWFDFYLGDVHFILLDGRYYRARRGEPSMLGPAQKRWLFDTLKSSRGAFKVLASPVPWSEGVKPGSRDPWDGFPEEREEIFSFMERQDIDGVLLIAADRHRTDLRVTKRPEGYDLWEFESSRLTNRHTHGVVKTPGLIWGYNRTCSFGLMRFDTTLADPRVTLEAIDIDGRRVHTHDLSLSQLSQ